MSARSAGYYELLEGTLSVSKIRDVDVSDLLAARRASRMSNPW